MAMSDWSDGALGYRASQTHRRRTPHKMKALSVRQPWAWAIIHARKDIENRTWKTHFRGQVAIHSSRKLDSDSELPRTSRRPRADDLICGAIIGVVDIIDVV